MSEIEKSRIHKWIDTETMIPFYGIRVRVNGRWMHLTKGKNPVFFDTRQEAKDFQKTLHITKRESV
jgi:hypothetical protein